MRQLKQITASQAAAMVKNGDVLFVGGFGMTGNPVHLLHALAETSIKDLTYVANNVGEPNLGGGKLLLNGQIKKMIGSFFTSNPDAVKAAQSGAVKYELLPQGTLAEAIRAGGAGLGGFYTPTSVGTLLAAGKEIKTIDGREFVFEKALKGNIAFVRAWRADTAGNLQYRMTEQNFNKSISTAADIVIAEVENIVPLGDINPEDIHTPCCYVDYLVQGRLSLDNLGTSASVKSSLKKVDEQRMNMVRRAFTELSEGDIVNLGIGIPTLVADLIKPEHGIIIHTENGMLGVGPEPTGDVGALEYPVNAGKIPVTALKGCSYFDSADSFAMIRGRHIDIAVMGGLEIDEKGNLANWAVPGKPLLGVGGAMDLASGAKRLIITMMHTNADGSSKIVPSCTLPITATNVVDLIITDLAVFNYQNDKLCLIELMPGATEKMVHEKTTAAYETKLTNGYANAY